MEPVGSRVGRQWLAHLDLLVDLLARRRGRNDILLTGFTTLATSSRFKP
jgi:hypothetical protein